MQSEFDTETGGLTTLTIIIWPMLLVFWPL